MEERITGDEDPEWRGVTIPSERGESRGESVESVRTREGALPSKEAERTWWAASVDIMV